jgi:hypothetical protein
LTEEEFSTLSQQRRSAVEIMLSARQYSQWQHIPAFSRAR